MTSQINSRAAHNNASTINNAQHPSPTSIMLSNKNSSRLATGSVGVSSSNASHHFPHETHHTSSNNSIPRNDSDYIHELSRRSVARAALHLGIEEMSGDTLAVLSDALLSYLETIGDVLARNVEHSGRSSVHVNVLDTLDAVETCTVPNAYLLRLQEGNDGSGGKGVSASSGGVDGHSLGMDKNGGTSNTLTSHQSTQSSSLSSSASWKGLASFLFGDDWYSYLHQIKKQKEEQQRLKQKELEELKKKKEEEQEELLKKNAANTTDTAAPSSSTTTTVTPSTAVTPTPATATVVVSGAQGGGKQILMSPKVVGAATSAGGGKTIAMPPSSSSTAAASTVPTPAVGGGKTIAMLNPPAKATASLPSTSSTTTDPTTTAANTDGMNADGKTNKEGTEEASNSEENKVKRGGWNAPHIGAIPSFPISNTTINNKHTTNSTKKTNSVSSSSKQQKALLYFHDLGYEEEACRDDGLSIALQKKSSTSKSTAAGYKKTTSPTKSTATTAATPAVTPSSTSKIAIDANNDANIQNEKALKAELQAEQQANQVPEEIYQNGITSFWGTVSSSTTAAMDAAGAKDNNKETNNDEGGGVVGTEIDDVKSKAKGDSKTSAGKSTKANNATKAGESNKRKRPSTNSKNDASSTAKKVRFNEGSIPESALPLATEYDDKRRRLGLLSLGNLNRRPAYVPSFLPPFPPEHTYDPSCSTLIGGSSSATGGVDAGVNSTNSNSQSSLLSNIPGIDVVGLPTTTTTASLSSLNKPLLPNNSLGGEATKSVRESLVTLEKSIGTSFWGSMPNNSSMPIARGTLSASTSYQNKTAPVIQVPASVPGSTNEGPSSRMKTTAVVTPNRPSMLTVSRILEGSLDTQK